MILFMLPLKLFMEFFMIPFMILFVSFFKLFVKLLTTFFFDISVLIEIVIKNLTRNKPLAFLLAAVIMFVSAGTDVIAQLNYFSNWPAGTSPEEIGKRVAENFAARNLEFERNLKTQYVIYPEVCAWYGSLAVAQQTKDRDLRSRLIDKFDQFLTQEGSKHISPNAHVDDRIFGVVPLVIYLQTKDMNYLELGKGLADKQWEEITADGITAEARYWIDDTYMVTALQVHAFRATGETKYLDRAALTMAAYLGKLQQPNGLFYHAPDSPFHWSRGNGWVAAGMTELLLSLPPNHPRRARILESYKKMMESLLRFQGEDGLWRQIIDLPGTWAETSGTAMFAFAMITGVKEGWLQPKIYGPAARKAWLGLVKYIDRDGNISDVCAGTKKGFSAMYYLIRPRRVGDLHGQAPVLWCVAAMLR